MYSPHSLLHKTVTTESRLAIFILSWTIIEKSKERDAKPLHLWVGGGGFKQDKLSAGETRNKMTSVVKREKAKQGSLLVYYSVASRAVKGFLFCLHCNCSAPITYVSRGRLS